MADQNFPDRVLYNMDNLDVLCGMNDETVDLIATDPSFNKKRNRAASAGHYEDAWRWADDPTMLERPDQWLWQPVHRIWLDQIQDENQALFQIIETTRLNRRPLSSLSWITSGRPSRAAATIWKTAPRCAAPATSASPIR